MTFQEKMGAYIEKTKRGEAIASEEIPSFNELLMTPDAGAWLGTQVATVLKQAQEPMLVGTTLLQNTPMSVGTSYKFMALGALRAFEIDEGQPYPEQQLAMKSFQEGRVSKKGLSFSMTDEVVHESQWGIWALHVQAAGRALARLKEEIIFNDFNNLLPVVFDNTVAGAETHGQSSGYNLNGSLHLDDLVDLVANVVTNEYQPTDIITHPLAWTIMTKDPFLRNFARVGMNDVWTTPLPRVSGGAANADTAPYMNAVAPWGLQFRVTPFITHQNQSSNNLTAAVRTGLADDFTLPANFWTTTMACVDRNNIGLYLNKQGPQSEEYRDPRRDVNSLKINEKYGIVILDSGYAGAVAKNVVVTKNYAIM